MPFIGSHTAIAPKVSPWYPLRMVSIRFLLACALECQYCNAIFIATSTATEPESAKKTLSNPGGVRSTRRLARDTAGW